MVSPVFVTLENIDQWINRKIYMIENLILEESNMKKFSIEYHETYGRTYEIEANSPEEAEEILRDMICNGEENAPEECENSWCDNIQEIK